MRLAARLMTALLVATLVLPALAVGPAFGAAADHLSVTVAPGSGTAGDSFDVTVTALDVAEAVDTGYTGEVHFTSTDSGGSTVLPGDYTFTGGGGDDGVHLFSGVVLTTAGNRTITATDTGDGSINGTSTAVDITAAAADHLVLSAYPDPTDAGDSHNVTVTAKDSFGNTDTGYGGSVTVTASGGTTHVSPSGASGLVNGARTYGIIFDTVGTGRSIDATGTSVTGDSQNNIDVNPAAADHLVLGTYPDPTTAGELHAVTVTAKDVFDNTDTNYAGLVTVTATGGTTHVSPSGATALANGVGSFDITFDTVGTGRSIGASGTGGVASDSQININVEPAAADHLVLSAYPDPTTAGVAHAVTVTALDEFDNVDTNYAGDVTVTASGGSTVVSPSGPTGLTNGSGSFNVTFNTMGANRSITASGTLGVASDTQTAINVQGGSLSYIVVSPSTATLDPGVDQVYTVESFDAQDNDLGDVTASSTFGISGGGTCSNIAHTCQAASVGAHTVTATHLTKTDTATLTINNVDPDAVADDSIFINEDAPATTIDVLNNDSDANTGDTFTITGKTDGSIGTVAIAVDNLSVTYTPDPENSGPDTFTYTITDNHGATDTATVSLTVVALNDAPSFTLGPDPTVAEDSGLQTVTGFAVGSVGPPNESAQTLTYIIDGDTNPGLFAALGEPAISPAGDLTFTPADETSGTATITVHVVDSGPNGGGDVNFSPNQTFLVTVTAVDDPPVAVDDGTITPYRVKAGVALVVSAAAGVLTNDTDVDTAANLLTAVLDTQGAHGTVALNADGSFTYTPTSSSFVGPDSFTYHANDGNGDSNIATVSIDIYLNHAPTAVSDVVTVVSGSGYVPLNLLTNDNAANPDAPEIIHITAASHPVHGTVVKTGLETGGWTGLSYRPYSGYIGSDVFTYTISDGVFTSTASVLVKVPKDTYKPVATAPVQTIRGQSIGTSTVKIRLAWTGTDKGYGIAKFELWSSVNGHSYTKIATTSGHSAYVTTTIGKSYRFRVRAIDKKANIGAFAYGPKFTVYRTQETSSAIVYSSPWSTLSSSSYSGGHAKSTTSAGFDATFTTLGRTLTWVAVRGPNRGTADVYVDSVLKAHVTLTSSTSTYRYVAYSITFTTSAVHSMQIVYTGPSTKRVDVDAFIFLR